MDRGTKIKVTTVMFLWKQGERRVEQHLLKVEIKTKQKPVNLQFCT